MSNNIDLSAEQSEGDKQRSQRNDEEAVGVTQWAGSQLTDYLRKGLLLNLIKSICGIRELHSARHGRVHSYERLLSGPALISPTSMPAIHPLRKLGRQKFVPKLKWKKHRTTVLRGWGRAGVSRKRVLIGFLSITARKMGKVWILWKSKNSSFSYPETKKLQLSLAVAASRSAFSLCVSADNVRIKNRGRENAIHLSSHQTRFKL